jgi:hypothetical protein
LVVDEVKAKVGEEFEAMDGPEIGVGFEVGDGPVLGVDPAAGSVVEVLG